MLTQGPQCQWGVLLWHLHLLGSAPHGEQAPLAAALAQEHSPGTGVRFGLALNLLNSSPLPLWLPKALSSKAECSSGPPAEGPAGEPQLITDSALATQGKNWNMLKKVLP